MDDRSAVITIGGTDYELLLTTLATKKMAQRYGGLEKFDGDFLQNFEPEQALNEMTWLITLLANQSILIHNLWNADSKKALLTEEMVDLLTDPFELVEYKNAIDAVMRKGTQRNVASESGDDSGGNAANA